MSFYPKIWLSLAPLTLIAQVQAQEKTAPPVFAGSPSLANEPEVSVEELIVRALQNSPQLSIARANLEAARQRAAASRKLLNPTLQAAPRLAGSREAADEELVVSQPLDFFGKRRAGAAVFDAQTRGAQAQNTLAERNLVAGVKNAAAELFAAQEAENLGAFQSEIARLFRDAAARRAGLGDVPRVQVQRAELELLRVENELAAARSERLVRRAALNGIIGQPPETPLRVTLPLPNSPSPLAADLEAQRAALVPLVSQRPDLAGAQAALEARQAQARAIARGRLPDVELQVRRESVFGSGGTALRAVVTVPLFDFGSLGREKKAAQAEVRASQAELELLRAQAATQLEQALIRLNQQRQTVETYRTGIVPQTLDLLRKTQIGYAQGASTYLEVLDAQRTLRAVQAEYLQALVGARTGEAALESALGATLPVGLTAVLLNPSGAAAPPGTAAPGTVPEGAIPPNPTVPLNPPSATSPGAMTPQGR